MKAVTIALLFVAATSAQAQSWLNSNAYGGNTFTNGTLYGQPFNSNTTRFGNNSLTSGTYGGQTFSGNSSTHVNTRFDNFNMGGRSVNCTTTTFGSYANTNCR